MSSTESESSKMGAGLAGIASFGVAALPRIIFGAGSFDQLAAELAKLGTRVLIVTGGQSFTGTERWAQLQGQLKTAGVAWVQVSVAGEPSPEQVDEVVSHYGDYGIDVVLGIGGGSALDAAKAIAGLLPVQHSVMEYLEGVGPELPYQGPALPLVAVPTTAGTGSEMTKNAVLTRHGIGGFKKSFRDEKLLPRMALVDPDLLHSCPPQVLMANAMDAFTQLLESYVSTRASAFTDALTQSGIQAFAASFEPGAATPVKDYSQLAYAAMLSGICLAQAGLGSVHGMASPLGAYFPIPHGVACGTLLAMATAMNIAALREREPQSPALAKYAQVAGWLGAEENSIEAGCDALVGLLDSWIEESELPRLSAFGMTEADLPRVIAGSGGNSMKTNPLVLSDNEIHQVLLARL
uniref:iron-containing alcohol dehydrogenase n=1 Tax=Marinobacterium profundum TaxID=1714300 RepID=UPI0009E7E09F|nr:iron-containing alcohol dehydrogenase [Marinobacterium profundum]